MKWLMAHGRPFPCVVRKVQVANGIFPGFQKYRKYLSNTGQNLIKKFDIYFKKILKNKFEQII
jgi:hypothetical protein